RTTAAGSHGRDLVMHGQEGPIQVDRDDPPPLRERHVGHRGGFGHTDPGVVHRDVECAEGRHAGVHHGAHGVVVGDLDIAGRCAIAEFSGDGFRGVEFTVGHEYSSATCDE